MAELREAILEDVPKLIEIGCKLIRNKMKLRPDKAKLKQYITRSISSKQILLLVYVEDLEIIAAMLTISDKYAFAEKQYAQIIGVYSSKFGLAKVMLDQTLLWVSKRRGIQMVCYSSTSKSRFDGILHDIGFENTGSMLIRRCYGTV